MTGMQDVTGITASFRQTKRRSMHFDPIVTIKEIQTAVVSGEWREIRAQARASARMDALPGECTGTQKAAKARPYKGLRGNAFWA